MFHISFYMYNYVHVKTRQLQKKEQLLQQTNIKRNQAVNKFILECVDLFVT